MQVTTQTRALAIIASFFTSLSMLSLPAIAFTPTDKQVKAGFVYAYWFCKKHIGDVLTNQEWVARRNANLKQLGLMTAYKSMTDSQVIEILNVALMAEGGMRDTIGRSSNDELGLACWRYVRSKGK